MKRRRKLFLGGVVLLLALGLFGVVAHYRAKFALERYKAQLRAQGEKLSIDELIPAEPIGQANGAGEFLEAKARLGSLDYKLQPVAMKMLQPGRGRIAWQQAALPTETSEDSWPTLRAKLQETQPDMDDLRKAIGRPVVDFQIDYQRRFEARLTHLAPLKSASQALSAETVLAMHDHLTGGAFTNLQALLTLPARFRGERFMISQLVRSAIVGICASTTWEALFYPEWADDHLAMMQTAWELVETVPPMARAVEMERACALVEYALARESFGRLDRMINSSGSSALEDAAEAATRIVEDPSAGFQALIDRFPRRWIWKWWSCYGDEAWFLRSAQRSLEVVRKTAAGEPFVHLQHLAKTEDDRNGEPPHAFVFLRVADPAGFYPSSVEAAVVSETQRRLVITAIALKRFERRTGKLPPDLTALVPGFLSAVPLDPMDGHPLRYRPSTTNSFLLYSVSLDGVDDHGDARPANPGSKSFYWMAGKDCVWPLPASAEQVREHDAKLTQQRAKKRR